MKQTLHYVTLLALLMTGCVEDTFVEDDRFDPSPQAPTDLVYAPVANAREFAITISAPPSYNSYGAVPTFEIIQVREGNGTSLDQSVIDTYFSILNSTNDTIMVSKEDAFVNDAGDSIRQYIIPNVDDIGRITINNENPLATGTYFFDIKMTTVFDEQTFETTFQDVFELFMGPAFPSGLVYIPGGQNLLLGSSASTTAPIVIGGNPDFRFALADNTDKFTIDPSSGEISLLSGYTPSSEPEIIAPTIDVISNITEEVVSFSDVVQVYISTDPVVIPKLTVSVFYPTFESENSLFGYRVEVLNQGNDGIEWVAANPSNVTAKDRPSENVNQKRLVINLVRPNPNEQVTHESWLILNSQDLSAYQFGFDLEAEFYTNNRFVEYLSENGESPSLMRLYVSTDYLGDFDAATWTDVSDELISNIEVGGQFIETNEFVGFPYPGSQASTGFPEADALKDPSRNAENKFTQSRLNMADYAGMNNVTFAFRVNTTFEGTITRVGNADRSGQYWLEDFHITAFEQ
ncbi:MAG: hypothetical protein AAF616_10010 [Bacteroidota bacterium]